LIGECQNEWGRNINIEKSTCNIRLSL
jgi:hypothetical protein